MLLDTVGPAQTEAAEESSHPARVYSVQAALDGDLALVPVNIAGRTYQFVVDTGCTHTIFDPALRSVVGDVVQQSISLNGQAHGSANTAIPEKVSIGPFPHKSAWIEMDLTWAREGSGREFYGLLGMDFLRSYRLTLDPDRNMLTLSVPDRSLTDESVPLRTFEEGPFVELLIDGWGREFFMVDTGCSGLASGSLPTAFKDALLRSRGAVSSRPQAAVKTLEGSATGAQLQLLKVSVGSFDQDHVELTSFGTRHAVLGMGFWSRFILSLDFPRGRAYLRPSRFCERAEAVDVSGLRLIRREGAAVVESVQSGSPALAADIRRGDQVLSIDDLDASKARLYDVKLRLSENDSPVRVVIRRGSKTFPVALHLKRWW